MVRVKICGITNLRDALLAAEAGADALGFNFWRGSPRYVSPAAAWKIIRKLPPLVVPVGLFVDERPATVIKVAKRLGLKVVQLHGEESPDMVRVVAARGLSVIKAFAVGPGFGASVMRRFPRAEMFLLDAAVPGMRGGTGRKSDWSKARKAVRYLAHDVTHGTKVFLAGGLTPANVSAAVKMVRPFGVDVSSGVERRPGVKSASKVREFIRRAKAAG